MQSKQTFHLPQFFEFYYPKPINSRPGMRNPFSRGEKKEAKDFRKYFPPWEMEEITPRPDDDVSMIRGIHDKNEFDHSVAFGKETRLTIT